MDSQKLRKLYLDFFVERGHKIIPSASLVPSVEVEETGAQKVLFTTAGMHPLIPYLLGKTHPEGKRLASVQKSLRTDDIDDVGDSWHNTFFEMLGNWSLGDYWKKEAITWSFEFLTQKLNFDSKRIYVTVFGGDPEIPGVGADEESIKIWKSLGIKDEKIFRLGKKDNWWGPVGETGPCGPDTEMFYDTGKPDHGKECQPGETCGKYAEIWNDVFMEFNKTSDGKYEPLKQKNVDTGMGMERTIAVLQGKDNVYDTELFTPIMEKIKSYAKNWNIHSSRIIADHLRAATFLIVDGVVPSNIERGYVLRRLIRRAIRYTKQLKINRKITSEIAGEVISIYDNFYPELRKNEETIVRELDLEEERFEKVIQDGLKKSQRIFNKKVPINPEKYQKIMQVQEKKEIFREIYHDKNSRKISGLFKKLGISIKPEEIRRATVSGNESFDLYQSQGFPIEMIIELVQEKHLFVDIEGFEKEIRKHQEISRAGMGKKFAGGLSNHSPKVIAGHTATHLLHQALRDVLGNHVQQTGSNITEERIRFDFAHNEKLTEEEIKKVEDIINSKIKANLPVKKEIMSQEEAEKFGAIGLFREKYSNEVSIYKIGDPSAGSGQFYSAEYCGGPHVKKTGELKEFKISKEKSIAQGRRRIYAKIG